MTRYLRKKVLYKKKRLRLTSCWVAFVSKNTNRELILNDRGKLSYLPASGFQPSFEIQRQNKHGIVLRAWSNLQSLESTRRNSRFYQTSLSSSSSTETDIADMDTDSRTTVRQNMRSYVVPLSAQERGSACGVLPSLESSLPSDWVTVEDDFALFYSVHQVGNLVTQLCNKTWFWLVWHWDVYSMTLSDMRYRHYASY